MYNCELSLNRVKHVIKIKKESGTSCQKKYMKIIMNFSQRYILLSDLAWVEAQDQTYVYFGKYDFKYHEALSICHLCIGSLAVLDTEAEFQHFRTVVYVLYHIYFQYYF